MIKSHKISLIVIASFITLLLNGCSTGYFDPAYKYPASIQLPKVPEIHKEKRKIPEYVPLNRRPVETSYSPKVSTYNGDNTGSISIIPNKEEIIAEAKTKAIVDIDPYDTIPSANNRVTSGVLKGASTQKSSPAVHALIVSAQSDMAVGKSGSAVSKLERGLRIEAQNPKLWNLLAKAHYDQSNYQQAISMSKKAIRYSSDDEFIASNWSIIKNSGLKSGDTIVVKEAINYFKVNP